MTMPHLHPGRRGAIARAVRAVPSLQMAFGLYFMGIGFLALVLALGRT